MKRHPAIDLLIRRAADLLGTSMAALTILDGDRQLLAAVHGLDAAETQRSHAICGFALLACGALCIPDLAADTRTWDHPLVVGDPYLRFYAGAPVVLGNGAVVGALCGFDTAPLPMVDAERSAALFALAEAVACEIDRPEHAIAYAERAADRIAEMIRAAARRDDVETIDRLDPILRQVERHMPAQPSVPVDPSEWTSMRAR